MPGPFLFGAVVGWFLYFNNRYRKEVAFSDVAGLLTAIAGGAVVGFFGQGADGAAAAGAYGAGVGFGFFGYLLVLVFLIGRSSGEFKLSYLIDGRRKNPDPGWGYGEGAQQPVRNMARNPIEPAPAGAVRQATPPLRAQAPAVPGTAALTEAIEAARRQVLAQFDASDQDDERARLAQLELQLDAQLDRLAAAEIRADLSSPAVQGAVAQLVAITGTINDEAAKMQTAAATIAAAAKVIGLVTQALQALALLA